MAAPGTDSRNLLELAVDVHTDLGKLATGLAHAGANPQAVASLQKMVEIIAEIAKLLGSGPVGAQGANGEAPGAAPAGPEAAPGGPPSGPAEAAAAGAGAPPGGPAGPGAPSSSLAHSAFHTASAGLQAALASKHAAAQRALAGQ